MDFDGLSMRACLRALSRQAAGARIRHITQPTELSLALEFRVGGGPLWVVCSADPAAACVFTTPEAPGTAIAPSHFCSLLRRHLGGLRLVEAAQEGWDRVGKLVFSGQDELGAPTSYYLAVEIMGKHSNVICVREDGRILDAIKRIGRSKSRVRQVLPGRTYELPPGQSKLAPDTVTGEELAEALIQVETIPVKRPSPAELVRVVAGLGPARARGILKAVAGHPAEPGATMPPGPGWWDGLAQMVRLAAEAVDADDSSCAEACREADAHFRTHVISSSGKAPPDAASTGSEARREQHGATEALQAGLAAAIAAAARAERDRHKALEAQAATSEDAETWLRRGNALLGSLGVVREMLTRQGPPAPSGDPVVLDLPDHFELDPAPAQAPEPGSTQGATIRVELQPGEEPARAAQRCLERYAELRRASEKLRELLEGSGARLRHLEQLAFELEQPLSAQEVAEAAHEAARFGITVVPARRASRAAASKTTATEGRSLPITLHSPGGFEVLVGRNNRQNEDLLRRGAPDDLWFHARGVPGAHVLLRRAGRPGEVPAEDTIFAAGLAAGHSRAAQATQAAVDCTELRLVRRGRGAVPGFVTYSGEKTLFVRPSGAEGEAGADRSD